MFAVNRGFFVILIAVLVIFLMVMPVTASETPSIEWQRCIGGSQTESPYIITSAHDGGYLISGNTYSTDGDFAENTVDQYYSDHVLMKIKGDGTIEWKRFFNRIRDFQESSNGDIILCIDYDFHLVKLNEAGETIWDRQYSSDEAAMHGNKINFTQDGGCIAIGTNTWDTGICSGIEPQLIKIDSAGNIQFKKPIGRDDSGSYYIRQTPDGGYLFAGDAYHDVSYSISLCGSSNATLKKFDNQGDVEWLRTYGGDYYTGTITPSTLIQNSEGYAFVTPTRSTNIQVSGNHGDSDIWFVKTDITGNLLQQVCYGGSATETPIALYSLGNEGYEIVGFANSNDGDLAAIKFDNGKDLWFLRTDLLGSITWQKSYNLSSLGGPSEGFAPKNLVRLSDGGFLLLSSTDHGPGFHGIVDITLTRFSKEGDILWSQCYGGSHEDYATAIMSTIDGGYLLTGYTSSNDGDVGGHHTWEDIWVVKVKDGATIHPLITSVSPDRGYSYSGADFNLTVSGTGISPNAIFSLHKSSQPEIQPVEVTGISPGIFECKFHLDGASPGFWDLHVTNPDDLEYTLYNCYNYIVVENLDTDWEIDEINESSPVTGLNSIKIDKNGNPHIIYQVSDSGSRLKYAWKENTAWHMEEVTSSDLTNLVGDVNFDLDQSGNPHISYSNRSSTSDLQKITYYKRTSNGWQSEIIDEGSTCSMALDKSGYPHFGYMNQSKLMYTFFDGTTWVKEDTGLGGSNLYSISLSLDSSDNPFIAYAVRNCNIYCSGYMRYFNKDTTGWHYSEIQELGSETVGKMYLTFDQENNVQILYNRQDPNRPYFVQIDGKNWYESKILDPYYKLINTVAFSLNTSQEPNIAFVTTHLNSSTNQNEIRMMYEYFDGSQWRITQVDNQDVSYGQQATSIALDQQNAPYISYLKFSGGRNKLVVAKVGSGSSPLSAAFTASPASGPVNMNVTFFDLSEGNATSWNWDFGDGNTSLEKNPTHIYSKTGDFNVTLTVKKGDQNNTYEAEQYISVYNYDTGDHLKIKKAVDWATGKVGPAGKYSRLQFYFVEDAYNATTNYTLDMGFDSAEQAGKYFKNINRYTIPPKGSFVWCLDTASPCPVALSLGEGKIIYVNNTIIEIGDNDPSRKGYLGWAWPPMQAPVIISPVPGEQVGSEFDLILKNSAWTDRNDIAYYSVQIDYLDEKKESQKVMMAMSGDSKKGSFDKIDIKWTEGWNSFIQRMTLSYNWIKCTITPMKQDGTCAGGSAILENKVLGDWVEVNTLEGTGSYICKLPNSNGQYQGIPLNYDFSNVPPDKSQNNDYFYYLQKILNSHPMTEVALVNYYLYRPSEQPIGSPGYESKGFGSKTKISLENFKNQYSLNDEKKLGLLDKDQTPRTISKLNERLTILQHQPIKLVPNGWVLQNLKEPSQNGYVHVKDVTDNIDGWIKLDTIKDSSSGNANTLTIDSMQQRRITIRQQESELIPKILKPGSGFTNKPNQFPLYLILAKVAQESGIVHYDNEFITMDPWGRGIPRIDNDDSLVGSASGIRWWNSNGDVDFCRDLSCTGKPDAAAYSCTLCRYCPIDNPNCEWNKRVLGKCDIRYIGSTCGCTNIYSRYDYTGWSCDSCKHYYTNTTQGIRASISDGLNALNNHYNLVYKGYNDCKASICVGGDEDKVCFSCDEYAWISGLQRYNGYNEGNPSTYLWNEAKSTGIAYQLKNQIKDFYYDPINKNYDAYDKEKDPISGKTVKESADDLSDRLITLVEHSTEIKIFSPGYLQVFDTEGRMTGMSDGNISEDIPFSIYDPITGSIWLPYVNNSFKYQVVGTNDGEYGLSISSKVDNNQIFFNATGIRTASNKIHEYTVDWGELSKGEDGVTIKLDETGNGTFETTIQTNTTWQPIHASFIATPIIGQIPLRVQFNDTSTGDPIIWNWSFGDGTYSILPNPEHTYSTEGLYSVKLTAENNLGIDSIEKTGFINVTNSYIPIDTTPPNNVTNLINTTYQPNHINWSWTDPTDSDFDHVTVYLQGQWKANVTKGIGFYNTTGLTPDVQYTLGTKTVDTTGNVNNSWVNWTARTSALSLPVTDTTSPGSINNLVNTTYQQTYINWSWTDPADSDFDHVSVYLDNVWKTNITKGIGFYNASGLSPDVQYTLGTKTVDTTGNVNTTWVNWTARTAALPLPVTDTIPPSGITNLRNTTYQQTYINWTWTDPTDLDFDHVALYLDGTWRTNITKGIGFFNTTGLSLDIQYTLGTKTVDTAGNVNNSWVNWTARTAALPLPVTDTKSPGSIINLVNKTYQQSYINWSWTDPADSDFDNVMVFLDDIFKTNVTKGTQTYTATGLPTNSSHTISTHTADFTGNVNLTWVNHTAWTAPLPPAKPTLIPFPGLNNTPTDPDGDGLYEDLDGDGNATFMDVIVIFQNLEWVSTNEPLSMFDYDKDSKISFYDVIALFNKMNELNPLPPAADFSATPRVGFLPLNVQFTDKSSLYISSWKWEFGPGGSTSANKNPNFIYNEAGNWTVNLTVKNKAGESIVSKTDYVIVTKKPVARFTTLSTLGIGSILIHFVDQSTDATGWYWDFGDGTNSTLQSPEHWYNISRDFSVTLTASNNGGKGDPFTIHYIKGNGTIPVLSPGVEFSMNSSVGFSPFTIQFKDQSTGTPSLTYQWNFGDGSQNSTEKDPVHTFTATTNSTYTITLTASNSAGSSSKSAVVLVNVTPPATPPVANFNSNTTSGFSPLPVRFTDTSTGSRPLAYQWEFGDGSVNSTEANPVHTFTTGSNQTFIVTLTVLNSVGSGSTSSSIVVNTTPPTQTFLADFAVSPVNGTAPLTVECIDKSIGNPTRFMYDFGDSPNVIGPNPVHTYRLPGTYNITLSITKYNSTTNSIMGASTTKTGVVTVTG